MRDAITTADATVPASHSPASGGDRRFALGWGTLSVALLVLAPFGPTLARFVPACPLKTLSGIPCPGCGTTRAALALASEPLHAFARYPIPTLAWTFLLLGGLAAGVLALAGRPPRRPRRLPPWTRLAAVVLLLAAWIWNVATGV